MATTSLLAIVTQTCSQMLKYHLVEKEIRTALVSQAFFKI